MYHYIHFVCLEKKFEFLEKFNLLMGLLGSYVAQSIDYVNTKFSHSCLQWSTTFLAAEPQPKMIGTRIAWSLCWAISSASLRNWMKEVKVRKSQKQFFLASNPFNEGFTALVNFEKKIFILLFCSKEVFDIINWRKIAYEIFWLLILF